MKNKVGLPGLLMVLAAFFLAAQAIAIEIPLEKEGGVYKVPVRINGVITLRFILDSGASEVVIPSDVAQTLFRANTIQETDFLPGKTYSLADGSELKSPRFVIRELEIGGVKINNVPGSIAPRSGDLLLGQSVLEKLNSWTLDNKRHLLSMGTSGKGIRSDQNVPLRTPKLQVAVPFRSIIDKAMNSPIPVYLPSRLEIKDWQHRPLQVFVVDNLSSFGPNSYTIEIGASSDCMVLSCLVGRIVAEVGSPPVGGQDIWLYHKTRAAYFQPEEGSKHYSKIVFYKDGVNYTFSLAGQDNETKDELVRMAESALQLGPLPKQQ